MIWTLTGFATLAFTVWTVVDCLRNEPDRVPWLIVILCVPTLGPVLYFLARWLPRRRRGRPPALGRLFGDKELRRLEWEAETIGNPHQLVTLGDAYAVRGRWGDARRSFEAAVAKERDSLPARWGAARAAFKESDWAAAREHVNHVLTQDERYKFGDASLLLGKCLIREDREADALLWMKRHTERWRQPEGLYLLASIQADGGLRDDAAATLRELLGELDHAPPAVARQHATWRRKAKALLRSLS